MGREQEELAILVTARDAASRVLKGVRGQVGALERAASKGAKAAAGNIERLALVGVIGAAALGGAAINMAIDWETAFAGVQKTIEDTPENIAAIGDEIRKMATEIPVAAVELAGIAETAGALGVEGKDNILSFTRVVALLGVTTDVTSEGAATSLGHLRTTLNLTGDDYEHLGNTLVDLGNKGASTESQILGMAEGVAGVANIVDLSTDQVLGWGAAWANTGEEIEAGSTEIQKFFLETFGMVNKGGKDLETLASIAGMSAKDFATAYREDASGALEQFLVQLGKLSTAEQAATLESLGFTDIRITRGLLKILANTDNLSDSLDTASLAWQQNNAMQIEASKRFKTTASQLQLLRNNVTEAGITIGTELLPVINELAQEGVAWLQAHPDEIKQAAKDIGEGFREAVTWAKSLDWDAIATALGAGAGAVKAIGDAFMALPAPVQGLLAGTFVANKFTGGAVGDVIGIAVKGALQGAGVIGGAKVGGGGALGALGRLAAQPVFVTNWPMGGLGGMPGAAGAGVGGKGGVGVLGTLGAVGLAAGLTALAVEIGAEQKAGIDDMTASIDESVTAQVKQGASKADLQKSQAAIVRGLADLKNLRTGAGNVPVLGLGLGVLNDLIAGDATRSLEAQLADVEAELARLNAGGAPNAGPQTTGPNRPQFTSADQFRSQAEALAEVFGEHAAAAGAFGGPELEAFRTTVEGAIGNFPELIRYLSGAQGSAAGTEQFLALVGRNIDALTTLLPSASAADAETIRGEIAVLEEILANKKFTITPATVEAVKAPKGSTEADRAQNAMVTLPGAVDRTTDSMDRTKAAVFDTKRATDRVYDATERVRAALYTLTIPPPAIYVTTTVSVSSRSVTRTQTKGKRAGNAMRLHDE
jgi:TP901 family phage tail tape measure protein